MSDLTPERLAEHEKYANTFAKAYRLREVCAALRQAWTSSEERRLIISEMLDQRDAAVARAEQAERERDEAKAILALIEWCGGSREDGWRCPDCREEQDAPGGHAHDCRLAHMLRMRK